MRLFWIALMSVAVACGKGDDNQGNTNSNTNGGTVASMCQTDEDCPGDSGVTFADPARAACARSTVRGNYCSECVNDAQCAAGYACRDATFCEELPPCNVGSDCADPGSEVHRACIARFCDFCTDDADCEDDEVCYSRLCATRSAVEVSCIDVSCTGSCDIEFDGDGVATGIACVQ